MEASEAGLRAIAGVLWRRAGLILACFALAMALAGLLVLALPRIYTATALIYFDPGPRNPLEPERAATGAAADDARIESAVEILRSDAVLRAVAVAENPLDDPEFGPRSDAAAWIAASLGWGTAEQPSEAMALQGAVTRLRDGVSIERRGQSYIISVSVNARDPERAARLANGLAEAYIAGQVRDKIAGVLAARAVLVERLSEARVAPLRGEQVSDGLLAADSGASVDLTPAQYQMLSSRSAELALQAELQIADSRVVSAALPPPSPSSPDMGLIALIAGLTGLSLGVGLALVRETVVGGFISATQATTALGRPVLAEIPRRKPPAGAGASAVADTLIAAPLSLYAEAIRKLRAGIDRLLRDRREGGFGTGRKGAVIMVASALREEGKTTTALSLARAYALSGQSTLIIDCDLRRPSLHRHLGIDPQSGLIDYLAGMSHGALSGIIWRDTASGLNVLTGSRHSEVPTDQLTTGTAFSRLMAAAMNNFDIIVLDTPPVGPMVDGLHLARYADIVAFVIRWAHTPQGEARSAMALLGDAIGPQADLVAILNQQDIPHSLYRRRYRGDYDER